MDPRVQRRTARRDVALAYRPELRQIRRDIGAERRMARQQGTRLDQIYQGTQAQLEDIGTDYTAATSGISGELMGNIQGLSGALGNIAGTPGMPAEEGQAVAGALGAIGATGANLLSSMDARQAGYMRGARTQSEFERANYQGMLLQNMRNTVDDLRADRMGLRREQGQATKARLDELRQTSIENALAMREFGLRKRIANEELEGAEKGRRAFNRWARQQGRGKPRSRAAWRRAGSPGAGGGGDRRRRRRVQAPAPTPTQQTQGTPNLSMKELQRRFDEYTKRAQSVHKAEENEVYRSDVDEWGKWVHDPMTGARLWRPMPYLNRQVRRRRAVRKRIRKRGGRPTRENR